MTRRSFAAVLVVLAFGACDSPCTYQQPAGPDVHCITCNKSFDNAEGLPLCEGTSTDRWNAWVGCVCSVCTSECASWCAGTDANDACRACTPTARAPCYCELQACLADGTADAGDACQGGASGMGGAAGAGMGGAGGTGIGGAASDAGSLHPL